MAKLTSPVAPLLLLVLASCFAPTHSFASSRFSSRAFGDIYSTTTDDDGPNDQPTGRTFPDEKAIRSAYFLQSSGFAPSKSIISSMLDNEPTTESEAKQSMATLEKMQRQGLLSRINEVAEVVDEYKDYIAETAQEWDTEWEFRQSAYQTAQEKASMKRQERLDAFLTMMKKSSENDQRKGEGSANGRLRFGMPYGERKVKKTTKKDKPEMQSPLPEVREDVKTDTPILSQIMNEKEKKAESDEPTDQHASLTADDIFVTEASAASTEDEEVAADDVQLTEANTANESTDETNRKDKPIDNLTLVQDIKNTESSDDKSLAPLQSQTDIAAAEQRAANARAAQEKADQKAKSILDAEKSKKEKAKAQAQAILDHAEEEAKAKIEKEQAEALQRQKKEEEAAKLKAEQEAEAARMQAEVEELARQQAEQEAAELARLQAEKEAEEARLREEEAAQIKAEEEEQARLHAEAQQQRIDSVESKMQSLTDKATSVTFDAKLEEGLYLVGVGVRKKAIINVYSVAMYASPSVLEALSVFPKDKQKKEAQVALRDAARSFDPSSPTTSFVLEMTFKADGKTIAGAIADSVKPRYGGSEANVSELESLIFEGVKSKGGQASKGTVFRFDCSAEGVAVSVDGNIQGQVECDTLGSAFVDVFMDDKAVSPKLVDSCIESWSGSGL